MSVSLTSPSASRRANRGRGVTVRGWQLRVTAPGLVVIMLGSLLLLPTLLKSSVSAAPTVGIALSGVVFNDYDQDGTRDTSAGTPEPGEQGITVTVVCVLDSGTDGVVGTADDTYTAPQNTTSAADGAWSMAAATTGGSPCRVEFTIPAAKSYLQPSGTTLAAGTTSTRFVATASTTVNFGVADPTTYCQTNPNLVIPCHAFGPAVANVALNPDAATGALKAFSDGTSGNSGAGVTDVTTFGDLGATYGVAPDPTNAGGYLVGSYVRRFSGLKAGNAANAAGTIFRVSAAGVVTTLATLPAGNNPHDDPTNSLPRTDSAWLRDAGAWDAVGKVGLGDMDLSADGTTLYVTNLADNSIYSVDVATGATTAVTPIPAPTAALGAGVVACAAAGDWRPFAIGQNGGKVYVGGVCSNQSAWNQPVNDNFRSHVYVTDGPLTAASTFTEVLTFRLDYARKCGVPLDLSPAPTPALNATTHDGTNTNAACSSAPDVQEAKWNPWFNPSPPDINGMPGGNTVDGEISYPTPMLTDLEFGSDGQLVLGLRDRMADQNGYTTLAPTPVVGETATDVVSFPGLGDQLKACRTGTSGDAWTLESNGSCGGLTSGGANQAAGGEGPGGGEFFDWDDADAHDQTMMGGLLSLETTGRVAGTSIDPITAFTVGVRWANVGDGVNGQSLRIAGTTLDNSGFAFNKANGLGDLAALCNQAPIQIGKRVWRDANNNGIQDPGEAPMVGVVVKLYDAAGTTELGTITTNANGEYLFGGVQNLGGVAVAPNTTYQLRIDDADGATPQPALAGFDLTGANAGSDTTDSDAVLTVDDAVINVTTGAAGHNNHTYDFGFTPLAPDVSVTKTARTAYIQQGVPVIYDIVVTNVGPATATNVVVTDDVPAGFTYNGALAQNAGWTGTGPVTRTIASLAIGATQTFTLALTPRNVAGVQPARTASNYPVGSTCAALTPTQLANPLLNIVTITYDNSTIVSNNCEPEEVQRYDLALRTVATSVNGGPVGPVAVGDTVTFTITVFNQGTVPANGIVITDTIPAGYTFPAQAGWTAVGPVATTPVLVTTVAPGASLTRTINLVVASVANPTTGLRNLAEISNHDDDATPGTPRPPDFDSTPDTNPTNDGTAVDDAINGFPGGTPNDEDDHDPAVVLPDGPDLSVIKTARTDHIQVGVPVIYDIVVEHMSGTAATNVVITDDVPAGFTFDSTLPQNAGWTGTATGPVTRTIPLIGIGDSETYELALTPVASPPAQPGRTDSSYPTGSVCTTLSAADYANPLLNIVMISYDNQTIVSNNCDFERVEKFDLALRKTVASVNGGAVGPVLNGDLVVFNLEVFNQGSVPAHNVAVTDYLPAGLSFDNTIAANVGWTLIGANPTTTVAGPLAPGASTTVSISLRVASAVAANLVNWGEISGADDDDDDGTPPPPDFDSTSDDENGNGAGETPGGGFEDGEIDENPTDGDSEVPGAPGDEDDNDRAELTPATPPSTDLSVTKTPDTTVVVNGQNVIYTIVVTNVGTAAAANIEVIDDVPPAFTFEPGANAGWSARPDGRVSTIIVGPLNPGGAQTLMLTLRVTDVRATADPARRNPAPAGSMCASAANPNNPLRNTVVIPDDMNLVNNCDDGVVGFFDAALRKRVKSVLMVGERMIATFDVEVFNQGPTALNDITVTDTVPAGYIFSTRDNASWTQDGDRAVTTVVAGPLAAGASTVVVLLLQVRVEATEAQWRNTAEITEMKDDRGTVVPDVDSNPDRDPNNDRLTDDVIDNTDGDEDDHDAAVITLAQVRALIQPAGAVPNALAITGANSTLSGVGGVIMLLVGLSMMLRRPEGKRYRRRRPLLG